MFVSCFRLHEGKERGGDLRFCLFRIQKFTARRRRKRVLRRLLLPLTQWHIGAVEELGSGRVSVGPEIVTNRFCYDGRNSVPFEGGARKRRCGLVAAHIFCPGLKAEGNVTYLSRPCDQVTSAWEVTDHAAIPSMTLLKRTHSIPLLRCSKMEITT